MFSHGNIGTKFERWKGQNMTAAARIEKQEVVEAFTERFRVVANNNAKMLAILGDVGPETAKNWLEGRNLPALATFINMARQSRDLRAAAFKLMDPEAEFDPEFQVECIRFAEAALKKISAV